jgi:XRE family transcriptional regulator, regulator of sulfur utilization
MCESSSFESDEFEIISARIIQLVSGLGVPFTAFIAAEPQVTVFRAADQTVLYDDDGRYQVYNAWNHENGHVEVFRVCLLPGCHRYSEPHAAGVVECVTVTMGSVEIAVGSTVHTLGHGDVLSFPGDMPHQYINSTDSATEVQLLILYP